MTRRGTGPGASGGGGGGTGDVVGPAVATDNAVTRYNGATGKLVQDSGVLISDSGKVTIPDDATTPPLNVTERSAAPTAPATGDIYLDDGTNTGSGNPGWRRWTGAAWEDISAAAGGGTGDVVGPASATNNNIALYSGTTGKLIKNSVVSVTGAGAMSGVTTFTATGDITANGGDVVVTTGGITVSAGNTNLSPRVTISDSAVTPPLNVTERSTAPSTPSSGDIYLDDGTNTAHGNPGWRRYTGAAWEDLGATAGGGGGGLPTMELITGLGVGTDYYTTATSTDLAGNATAFTVCCVFKIIDRDASTYQILASNSSGFGQGWRLEHDSGNIRWRTAATTSSASIAVSLDYGGLKQNAIYVAHGVFDSTATGAECQLYVQGTAFTANTGSYSAGNAAPLVGNCNDFEIGGLGFWGSTAFTHAQVREHVQEIFDASNMADYSGVSADNLYVASSGASGAPATWTDDNGLIDLTRTGTPGSSVIVPKFGW